MELRLIFRLLDASLAHVGLNAGDVVVIDSARTPRAGDAVVVCFDGRYLAAQLEPPFLMRTGHDALIVDASDSGIIGVIIGWTSDTS